MTEVVEGHRQEAQRRLRTATCKRRNAAVIASVAELTPPSVVLGLDPRTHAGRSAVVMDSRLKAWNDGGWGGPSAGGPTEVADGDLQEAQRCCYCLTILSRSSPHPPSSSGLTRGPMPAPRLRLWVPGSGPGMTEVVEGHRQEAQRCCYCLTIAGFATEPTPPSVVLGLDPRTHAGRSAVVMDSRLKAWNDGGWGGPSAGGPTEVADGDLQEAQRRCYFLTTAGFATEPTPPSVVLGLDPRTHAGPSAVAMDSRPKVWNDEGWGGRSASGATRCYSLNHRWICHGAHPTLRHSQA
ncbi:hypothetical protein GGI59_005847 [Rhizobium lentis]|uniref:Uncharacterized protein n=1 Tax=Rhizobium lentis TaxID=1138194 RepID=A0A7W8XJR8_9HYPH|nr:hypothetical protein [Rhizobium lentis]MBB5553504.1 hypothetical protein [Rhizobium lentis]MBB5564140.1 hypothetical protein [Rhizobium lentis]MBB5570552.1 hypothetical protein [Rhizobium lentis]